MTEPNRPNLNNSLIDRLASGAKGITGAIPFVGSIIAEIVGNVIPNQRIDRLARFVEQLSLGLDKIENAAIAKKFDEPMAIDLIEDAFVQASRATSDERLDYIASVVANGLEPHEVKHADTKRILWLLGQLNDSEIVILRSRLALTKEDIVTDAEFREKHNELLEPDATYMGSSEVDFENAAIKTSYRQHLSDLGLIRTRFTKPRKGDLPEFDDSTGMLKSSGTEITRLGKMLLKYLDLIPEWYQR